MLGRLFGSHERAITNVPWGATSPSSPWGYWPGDGSYGSGTADPMQLLAVLGCVQLITDQISQLPVDVFRKSGDERIEVTPPDWLVEPTVDLSFPEWCGQVLTSLLLHGNAYIAITRNASAAIVELIPLDPASVTVDRSQGEKRYLIHGRPGAEILHVKGIMLAGSEVGLSPIQYARETIGLGLKALNFGAEFFNGDGNMPGIIEIPKPALPNIKTELAQQWQRKRRAGGKGLPGVLDDGAVWKPTGVTNEDAQFLATRQYTAAEIAGQLFLIDPAELGIPVEGTSLTYSNQEQRNARLVRVSLLRWMIRIEAAVSALLARPRYMKFNVDGLLRGDFKTQMEAWSLGVDHKILVPNEPRAWMNLEPLPGGDVPVSDPVAPEVPDE
jgi:HK97 family phage portal protein